MEVHPILQIKELSKHFGRQNVLDAVSLDVLQGQCCLLVGKNGSGKTTLLRCVMDLILPESGEIWIDGRKYADEPIYIKKMMGIISEDNPLIPEFTAYQHLEFVGLLHKIPVAELKSRIAETFANFFDDASDLHKKISAYSTGMKKKLSLCAAILHRPTLLILDEPFHGLDRYSLQKFIEFFKFFLSRQGTIFFTSHTFAHLDEVVSHVALLDAHKIIFHDSIEDFTDSGKNKIDDSLLRVLQEPDVDQSVRLNW